MQDEPATSDHLDGIPENLRFDLPERSAPDVVPFALGGNRHQARRPKEYTMIMLGAAMSGMSDGPDAAYAIMTFCHDAFDAETRKLVSCLDHEELYDLITRLCEHWGTDTSSWDHTANAQPANRAARRAGARTKR